MTIHAAKGLEFPIVILSGMTSQNRGGSGVQLLWPPGGGYAVKLKKSVQTGDFDLAYPVDEQMDEMEKLRLLYVAATRARDHLVVSLHRAEGSKAGTAARVMADAGGATAAGAVQLAGDELVAAAASPEQLALPLDQAAVPPAPFDAWLAGIAAARAATRMRSAVSASGLEGTEPDAALDPGSDPGLANGPRDLDLPPWSKGRYGSAVGRAVHAVLQVVDLRTGDGLEHAVTAQAMAEGVLGHEDMVRRLAAAAIASDVVRRAAAREHWRETYVGTVQADGVVLEGYVDLIYREDDGTLVIVDYKTDAVPSGAIASRVTYYKPQMDAYRRALVAATGANVTTTLLFLHPSAAVAVPV
jgi:ATP-dependent helicase/nuclease subunit A